jgi:exopolyphosphatase/guanosine-5'-triphosphate,3'-diphosphate pyrophosphatase
MTKHNHDKIAVIDIGSNAMRLVLADYVDHQILTISQNFRYPIRLGEDVFKKGEVSPKKLKQIQKSFKDIAQKIQNYHVQNIYAYATSALRDSSNKKLIIKTIRNLTGIHIKTIDGVAEANFIRKAVGFVMPISEHSPVMVDIGGGSTEITILNHGQVLFCKSYQIGTVRLLKCATKQQQEKMLHTFINKFQKDFKSMKKKVKLDFVIGTGGI